ncbi:hypothetical protein E4U41_001686 [Claviceps citrina]|nr:hypothetical protein E4U41_001686 [Claviceps citrina]
MAGSGDALIKVMGELGLILNDGYAVISKSKPAVLKLERTDIWVNRERKNDRRGVFDRSRVAKMSLSLALFEYRPG